MRALDRKLLRDLWQMKSQVLTIALVVASAIAGFIGSLSTYDSLEWARQSFYDQARFGHVFTNIKRAPKAIERRIAEIPGVVDAETTVVYDVTMDIAGIAEPVTGRMIGLTDGGRSRLNQLVIRRGRSVDPERPHEMVVSEGFANALIDDVTYRSHSLLCGALPGGNAAGGHPHPGAGAPRRSQAADARRSPRLSHRPVGGSCAERHALVIMRHQTVRPIGRWPVPESQTLSNALRAITSANGGRPRPMAD